MASSAALALTGVVALAYGEREAVPFWATAIFSFGVGLVAFRRTGLDRDLTIREGYAVVALTWITVGVVGAVPYVLTGVIESPVAALFESVSGFTTTGATVFAEVESLPRAILF